MILTKQQYVKYLKINENGFGVDMYDLSCGAIYPTLKQVLYEDINRVVYATISFYKNYYKECKYTYELKEYTKVPDTSLIQYTSLVNMHNILHTEVTKRFNFKYMVNLSYKFNIEELKTLVKNNMKEA